MVTMLQQLLVYIIQGMKSWSSRGGAEELCKGAVSPSSDDLTTHFFCNEGGEAL